MIHNWDLAACVAAGTQPPAAVHRECVWAPRLRGHAGDTTAVSHFLFTVPTVIATQCSLPEVVPRRRPAARIFANAAPAYVVSRNGKAIGGLLLQKLRRGPAAWQEFAACPSD